jgi:hypothetical protein
MRSMVQASAALCLVFASAATAHAAGRAHTQFMWKDSSGTPHYSDTLTVEALQFGYDVLNDKGIAVKHVDRQRTPEELFAEETAAAAAAAIKREADQQILNDKRMIAAYPTEHDFVAARQSQLDSIDQNIKAATNSLGVQERSLSDALAHADGIEHSGKPIPDTLQKQIESLRKSAEALRAYVGRRQKEKVDATKRFNIDLEHYRETRAHENALQQP